MVESGDESVAVLCRDRPRMPFAAILAPLDPYDETFSLIRARIR